MASITWILVGLSAFATASPGGGGASRPETAIAPQDEFELPVPDWLSDHQFPVSSFTFVRIQYDSHIDDRRRANMWATDYPDADLGLIRQLARYTRLDVADEPLVLRLTDEAVIEHSLIYMVEAGRLSLGGDEVMSLRGYLTSGGMLVMDDSWGDAELENILRELRRVFPDRRPVELPLDHELFHQVFDLDEKPQVFSIAFALTEGGLPEANEPARYLAIADDDGRLMVVVAHNTDLGDGWERAGQHPGYTRDYSVARAFPMGFNLVAYALSQRGE